MEKSESFYQNIPVFTEFSTLLDPANYHDVPDDWFVLLTDIKGSTAAIENGQYHNINMIGAASITCVLNTLGALEIPYVFGGDGASLLIPSRYVETISAELRGLQFLAQRDFKLDLRVGFVSVQKLREKGFPLKVARYQLSPGNCLAQFRGGGLTAAEEMVKRKEVGILWLEPEEPKTQPNLEGLSCRISPIKSNRGEMLSLICKLRDEEKSEVVLQEILDQLKFLLGVDFRMASPVSASQLKWKLIPSTFRAEAHIVKKGKSYFRGLVEALIRALIANVSLIFNIRLGPFIPAKYKKEILQNSDFKKFDEKLRMVVDCTPTQALGIENLMKSYFENKKIFYGIHRSREALMTCMVFSASQNQHVHFIDGGQGGYTLAAAHLKKQIAIEAL